jgi:tetratricopeptide (TPR) repeat protein
MRAWRLRNGGVAAHAGTRADRTRAWALVFALGAYAVFALTDHQVDVPLFTAVLAGMLAILSALTRPERTAHVTWSPTFVRVVPALLVAAALAVLAAHARVNLLARKAFEQGIAALEQGDVEDFDTAVRRARRLAPGDPFYPNQLAFHLLDRAHRAEDEARATALRAEAVTTFQESLAISPAQEICETNLGWLLLDAGEPLAAEQHFRAAARLVPDKGAVYFGLGLALLLQGREDEAVHALALEWLNDPRFIAHPVWTREDWRERRAAVMREAQVLLADLVASGVRPREERTAAYLHALLAWWLEPTRDHAARAEILAQERSEEARLFFATLRSPGAVRLGDAPWQIVHRAWSADEPEAVLQELPPEWETWAPALAQRIRRHRDSFAAFLTGPGADADGLVRRYSPERTAYGMLARNSDGLRIRDQTPREVNVLVDLLPEELFPRKGWVPSPLLVRWLEGGRTDER